MPPLSRSPARIASVEIPSGSLRDTGDDIVRKGLAPAGNPLRRRHELRPPLLTGLCTCQLAGGDGRCTVALWPVRVPRRWPPGGARGLPTWPRRWADADLWAEMGIRTRSEPTLLNRQRERAVLDGLLGDLRAGRGRALVVRGEAGVGKSALLDCLAGAAVDMRVARAVGAESEMELAFAGLHLLCAPLLGRLEGLPGPQRDALGVAFGLREGDAPDRVMVGLAVLTLLAEVAEDRPLLCLVDDAQWLDRASAQVLVFAARRLLAEPVGLVFAARDPGEQLGGLPDLEVRGLRDADARGLLRSVVRVRLDEQVRDRILAETRGNPLALLELPRGLSPAQLAGGFGLTGAQTVPARVEENFRNRLQALPADTRLLLLVAAADPTGDPVLVRRAAGRLGIAAPAAAAAEADGLAEIGARVRFRHPLVRSP